MCGPLNRKGLVCSECANGFGPSVTSFLLHVAVINKLCMQMDNPVSLNLYILQSEF